MGGETLRSTVLGNCIAQLITGNPRMADKATRGLALTEKTSKENERKPHLFFVCLIQ